jgi:hypothetical protein
MVARRVPLRRRDLFWITHNCSPERTPRRRTWCPPAGFRRENKFRISQLVSAIVLLRSFDAGGSQLGDARLNVRTLGSLPAFGPNDGSRGVVERIAASNRRSTVLLGCRSPGFFNAAIARFPTVPGCSGQFAPAQEQTCESTGPHVPGPSLVERHAIGETSSAKSAEVPKGSAPLREDVPL